MPSGTISRQAITDAVMTRLGTLTWLTAYRVDIPGAVPLLPNDDNIAPYVVAYPYGGSEPADQPVDVGPVDLDYTVQLSCVAGYPTDLEYLVDQVYALFYLWTPTVSGLVCGRFRPPNGFDPGPVQPNRDILPPRFSMPLEFRTTVTTI